MSDRSVSRQSSDAQHGFFQRGEQLQFLLDAYDRCAACDGVAFVTVTGEAGLGKTRFLMEFENRLVADPSHGAVRVAYGRALSARSVTSAFLPIREALEDLVRDEGKKDGALMRLGGAFRETAPDWLAAIPTVGGLLSAVSRTAGHFAASGESLEPLGESMNRQFLHLLESLVEQGPLVILLDDLHWADASTMDLLLYLAETLRGGPLFVVMSYRDDDTQMSEASRDLSRAMRRLERYLDVERVQLTRLDATGIAQIIADTSSADPAGPAVQWLLERSDGNPLFLHEYLALLRDRGLPEQVLTLPSGDSLDVLSKIPRRIESILAERLDYLDEDQERTLQVASILGPVFGIDDVIAISDLPREQTRKALRALSQRASLIRPVPAASPDDPVVSYSFFHNLVASYVADELEDKDPYDFADLHRRCAEHLALQPGLDLGSLQDVAYHFHAAKSHPDALKYGLSAAREATRLGALREAQRYFTWSVSHARALALPDQTYRALIELGWVQQQLGETAASLRSLQEAEHLEGNAPMGLNGQAELQLQLAKACRMLSMWAEARHHLELAQGILSDTSGEAVAQASLFGGELALCGSPPAPSEARKRLLHGLEHAESPGLRSALQGHLGLAELVLERPDEAASWLEDSRASAEQTASPYRIYEAHHWQSKLYLACLDLLAAGRSLEVMTTISEESGVFASNPFHARDSARRWALAGDADRAADGYLAYAERATFDEAIWTRIFCQLALLCEEIDSLFGQDQVAAFANALLGSLTARPRLQSTCPPLPSVVEEVGRDYLALLSGEHALASALEIDDMRRVYDFDVVDLQGFRVRHGFAAAR